LPIFFRNSNLPTNPYPFTTNNLLTFTKTNATIETGFYYYLYDMKISSLNCASDRIPVVPQQAPKPVVTKVSDSLFSSFANNYQWYFNQNVILGQTTRALRVNKAGSYKVRTSNSTNCQMMSEEYIVIDSNQNNLIVYPNPASNIINFRFTIPNTNFAKVCLSDVVGKIVAQQNLVANNSFMGSINTETLRSGIYVLQIITSDKTISRKIVVVN
jgi:hypothetical protein